LFSLERVSKSGAKFDPEKAKWFNQQYLRKRTPEQLAKAWMPELKTHGVTASEAYVEKVCVLLQEKAQFIHEFWALGNYFFTPVTQYDETVLTKKWDTKYRPFFEALLKNNDALADFTATNTEQVFKTTCEQLGLKPGEVMQLYRVAVTGQGGGPALFEIITLIGKEELLNRLSSFLQKVS
jgi:glutamyl-tRNA synthetase